MTKKRKKTILRTAQRLLNTVINVTTNALEAVERKIVDIDCRARTTGDDLSEKMRACYSDEVIEAFCTDKSLEYLNRVLLKRPNEDVGKKLEFRTARPLPHAEEVKLNDNTQK